MEEEKKKAKEKEKPKKVAAATEEEKSEVAGEITKSIGSQYENYQMPPIELLKRVETIYIVPETEKTVIGEIKEIKLGSVNSIKIVDSVNDEISTYEVSENCVYSSH